MKFISILIICLLTCPTAFAAEKSTCKSKTKKASKMPWHPVAFSEKDGRLPKNYIGLDGKKFYKLFKEKVENNKKGEFETTEEYSKRSTNIDAILSPISTTELYAFQFSNYFTYDADKQGYKIWPEHESICEGKITSSEDHWVTCRIVTIDNKRTKYIGSNAYGASINITKIQKADFALAISKESLVLKELFTMETGRRRYNSDKYRQIRAYAYKDFLSISSEKAKSIKDYNIAVLFVGNVTDAKIINSAIELTEPTFDSPYDEYSYHEAVPFELKKIIYYVVQTGEILDQKMF